MRMTKTSRVTEPCSWKSTRVGADLAHPVAEAHARAVEGTAGSIGVGRLVVVSATLAGPLRETLHVGVLPVALHEQELVVVLLRAEADELAAVGVRERDARVRIEPERVDGLEAVALVLHAVLPFPLGAERAARSRGTSSGRVFCTSTRWRVASRAQLIQTMPTP